VPSSHPNPLVELHAAAMAYTSAWRRLITAAVLADHIPPSPILGAFTVTYTWVTEELIGLTPEPEPPEAA
jgi:hypothetical protein